MKVQRCSTVREVHIVVEVATVARRMPPCVWSTVGVLPVWFFCAFVWITWISSVTASNKYSIYWNSTNPM